MSERSLVAVCFSATRQRSIRKFVGGVRSARVAQRCTTGMYNLAVRRFAFAIIVACLSFSASGVSALIVTEPCTGYEQADPEDGACPPTCVTCGCCAQAVEPAVLPVTNSFHAPVVDVRPLTSRLPKTTPRDILHVPKTLA